MDIVVNHLLKLATSMYDEYHIPYSKDDEENIWFFSEINIICRMT